MTIRYVLILLASLIYISVSEAAIICPPMPTAVTEINRDIKSDITASVGKLGPVKAGEVAVKTEVVANNLFSKYPNVDKLLALQTMAATYCAMLQSISLSDTERLTRWEIFQDKVLNIQSSTSVPVPKTRRDRPANGSSDKLRAMEARIGPATGEQCAKLARWPSDGTNGESISNSLSKYRSGVEDASEIFTQHSKIIASLYRCSGGARLISEGELPDKISGALPLLRQSVLFDPSQTLLRSNISTLERFLKEGGGDGKTLFLTIFQVLRGSNDPELPGLAEQAMDAIKK